MQRSLLVPDGPPGAAAPPRLALAAKGFRPFFLLAAAYAAAIVPLWLLALAGMVRSTDYLAGSVWHAHEMIFGFAVAVIAGFLLTAVGNWTGRETATGSSLIALAAHVVSPSQNSGTAAHPAPANQVASTHVVQSPVTEIGQAAAPVASTNAAPAAPIVVAQNTAAQIGRAHV